MNEIFAIGDIHGKISMFKEMLKQWNPDKQQLILLGDLIDRGEDSYGVIQLAKELKEKYGAVVLTGNHEQMLLDWLQNPHLAMKMYYRNGGRETIHSFFNKTMTFGTMPEEIADLMQAQFSEEISFLSELPRYFEWNKYVFVHAGVDLTMHDWKETALDDFCWIREEFHYQPNNTDKMFIFGHTPTKYLNLDESTDVWISPCKTKIGIDGGAVFGGQLHGLNITNDEMIAHSINKELKLTTKSLGLSLESII